MENKKKLSRQELVAQRSVLRQYKDALSNNRLSYMGYIDTDRNCMDYPIFLDSERMDKLNNEEEELIIKVSENKDKYKKLQTQYRSENTFKERVRNLVNDVFSKKEDK